MSRFKELRIARGLTQEQCAAACGVGSTLIRQMDAGYRPVQPVKLHAITAALGMPEAELFGKDEAACH